MSKRQTYIIQCILSGNQKEDGARGHGAVCVGCYLCSTASWHSLMDFYLCLKFPLALSATSQCVSPCGAALRGSWSEQSWQSWCTHHLRSTISDIWIDGDFWISFSVLYKGHPCFWNAWPSSYMLLSLLWRCGSVWQPLPDILWCHLIVCMFHPAEDALPTFVLSDLKVIQSGTGYKKKKRSSLLTMCEWIQQYTIEEFIQSF